MDGKHGMKTMVNRAIAEIVIAVFVVVVSIRRRTLFRKKILVFWESSFYIFQFKLLGCVASYSVLVFQNYSVQFCS